MQHALILSHFYLKILRLKIPWFSHPGVLHWLSLPPFFKEKKEIKLNYKLNYKTNTIIYKSYEHSIMGLSPHTNFWLWAPMVMDFTDVNSGSI